MNMPLLWSIRWVFSLDFRFSNFHVFFTPKPTLGFLEEAEGPVTAVHFVQDMNQSSCPSTALMQPGSHKGEELLELC